MEPVSALPPEILTHIFNLLPDTDKITASNVCKRWKETVTQHVWLNEIALTNQTYDWFLENAADKKIKSLRISSFIDSLVPNANLHKIQELRISAYDSTICIPQILNKCTGLNLLSISKTYSEDIPIFSEDEPIFEALKNVQDLRIWLYNLKTSRLRELPQVNSLINDWRQFLRDTPENLVKLNLENRSNFNFAFLNGTRIFRLLSKNPDLSSIRIVDKRCEWFQCLPSMEDERDRISDEERRRLHDLKLTKIRITASDYDMSEWTELLLGQSGLEELQVQPYSMRNGFQTSLLRQISANNSACLKILKLNLVADRDVSKPMNLRFLSSATSLERLSLEKVDNDPRHDESTDICGLECLYPSITHLSLKGFNPDTLVMTEFGHRNQRCKELELINKSAKVPIDVFVSLMENEIMQAVRLYPAQEDYDVNQLPFSAAIALESMIDPEFIQFSFLAERLGLGGDMILEEFKLYFDSI